MDRNSLTAHTASDKFLELVLRFSERSFFYEWSRVLGPNGKLSEEAHIQKTWLRNDYYMTKLGSTWWQQFPKPDSSVYEWHGMALIKIFMDDLHICPKCGQCWPFNFKNEFFTRLPEWIGWEQEKIRDLALSRLDAKEFYFAQCPTKSACDRYQPSGAKRLQGDSSLLEGAPALPTFEVSQTVATAVAKQEATTNFVYLLRQERSIKIGIARKPEQRLSALRIGSPFKIELLKAWPCKPARKVERALHGRFRSFRKKGEWFDLPEVIVEELLQVESIEDFVFQKNQMSET